MPTLLFVLIEALGNKWNTWSNEIGKIQGRALQRIFNLPTSTSYFCLIMETST